MRALLNFSFYLIVMAVLASCTGTNTGNPGLGSAPASGAQNPQTIQLTNLVCLQVASCFQTASSATCESQILSVNAYTSQLGTIASGYATVTDLETAELAGAVQVNTPVLDSCLAAIQGLSCSSQLMQQAYSSSSPNNYSATNLVFQVSATCQEIYF